MHVDGGATAASRRMARRLLYGAAAAGAAASAYMTIEAQWVQCRQADLHLPRLPSAWSGLRVLHLSDVHAGLFPSNERSLAKVVRWAEPLSPDLVFLTGDVFGDPQSSLACLRLLARMRPKLGMFAVTGNHEFGLGRGPLARARDTSALWQQTGITLLSDRCVSLPPRNGAEIVICGADYLSGGFGLLDPDKVSSDSTSRPTFSILLVHEPPLPGSCLVDKFDVAFAGHTHGGQLRLPSRTGLTPLRGETGGFVEGVHAWGSGSLVVSRGIGTSFLPFRLLTRPEATVWRLV